MKKKLFAWLLAAMLCIPTALQVTAAEKPTGDINADGVLDIMDVILLQKWLLAVPDTHIADPEAGDYDADGTLDVFDLALMKMAVVGNPTDILPPYYKPCSWHILLNSFPEQKVIFQNSFHIYQKLVELPLLDFQEKNLIQIVIYVNYFLNIHNIYFLHGHHI